MQQLAIDHGDAFPLAAEAVRQNMYVDFLAGQNTLSSVKRKVEHLNKLLMAGGFRLHKWAANCDQILDEIDSSRRVYGDKKLEDGPTMRALGLSWNPVQDTFVFTFQQNSGTNSAVPKRSVLSAIAMFDPLGWLAPGVILAKIPLQEMWTSNLQ